MSGSAVLASAARGAGRTLRCGVSDLAAGWRTLRGRRARSGAQGSRVLLRGVGRLLVQVPVDATLLVLGRAVSWLQTLAGLSPPARPLDDAERALVARVFAAGVDARWVSLKIGRLGILGWPQRAFVLGDMVHVPRRGRPSVSTAGTSLAAASPALLVHELTHVAQHQRLGTRYLSECLLAQWLGEGYNVGLALAAGRHWEELNFEQQAELVERAFGAGWFEEAASRRLFVRLTDPARDDGFEVRSVDSAEEPPTTEAGWRDATDVLTRGLGFLRQRA